MCSDRVLLLATDAVEKGFFSFDRVRLIQDQAQARNVDSKSSPPDSIVAFSYSTASARRLFRQHRPKAVDSGPSCEKPRSKQTRDPLSARGTIAISVRRQQPEESWRNARHRS